MKGLIIEDKFSPFGGELKDQEGNLISPDGEVPSVDEIIKMNWLVSNVVGEIPEIEELDEEAKILVEMKGVQKDENSSAG